MKRLRHTPDWIGVTSLLGLTVLFFWKIALTNLILVGLDVFTYFYPYKAYAAQAIRQGSVPLWNPYLFMGVPFLANIQAATLYPLNLPFYWLPAPKMVSYSIVLHVFLGGAFTYLFARKALRMGPWGAFVAALTFGLGGFLGAQVEHVNQLSVLIWLPLLLWLFHVSYERRGMLYPVLAGLVTGVQFLGGHTQASYINLFALGCYALYLSLADRWGGGIREYSWRDMGRRVLRALGLFVVVILVGGGLAAFQLLPTYELSTLSVRSGGLSYRQAVSFSLRPGMLALSLLPSLQDSPFSEYVAYVGIIPLSLACLGIWRRGRQQQAPFFISLSVLGLFLALGGYDPLYYLLYRLVPGFSLFRAPARWLYLYALGMSVLAGLGVEELAARTLPRGGRFKLSGSRKRLLLMSLVLVLLLLLLFAAELPSPAVVVTWLALTTIAVALLWLGLRRQRGARYLALMASLVATELLIASRYLAYSNATAPEAFSSARTSVAHLMTDEDIHRFLSFSDGSFDPGDLQEIQRILAGQLSEEAVYDYIVATKEKEIVTPNLSLLYRLESIDGYDGGVLPLARYVELQRLLLPEEEVSADGRLQGRIREIPRGQILNLFNVKYILTDKVYDVWVDGVFYDLGHRAVLGDEASSRLVLDDLPTFPSTALGVVSYLIDGRGLEQGEPVAEITVRDAEGHSYVFTLRAGEDTAEGEYDAGPMPSHRLGRVVGHWRGNPQGNDYHTPLEWGDAIYPQRILVRYLAAEGQLRLRGMTLMDQRTGTHQTLMVSTEARYRLVHSGDVKIYQNLDVLPRAFVVHETRVIQENEAILRAMLEESFAPDKVAVLSAEVPAMTYSGGTAEDRVTVLSYEPELITIEASLQSPGYLVLTDAYYPGWRALVDGRPADILRADLYFRAVYLPRGDHVVRFVYTPFSFRLGMAVSVVTGMFVVGVLGWMRLRK